MRMQSLKEFSIYTKKTLSVRDTYALRANAEALGVTKMLLTENAGANIANELLHKHKNDTILVVSGCGNKGAIGLSVARHLLERAKSVEVVLLCKPEEITDKELKANYDILSKLIHIESRPDSNALARKVRGADVVIDAIVGIGLHGRPDSCLSAAIGIINKYSKHTVSIDIPSGINPDTGLPNVASIKAQRLYVLYKSKPFLITREYAQNVEIIDMGFPYIGELLTGPGDVMLATEARAIDANKYTSGGVLIVGGSKDYKGAPLLTSYGAINAFSALYVGTGYVTVAMPRSIAEKVIIPNLIVKGFSGDSLKREDISGLGEIKHDVMIIGPGLAQDEESLKNIIELIRSESAKKKGVIIDATAIKAVAQNKNVLGKNVIITPHDGEFGYLTGKSLKGAGLDRRAYAAIEFAKAYKCTVVLKGHETIITNGELLKINMAETPTLATMGSGDVLAGIIGSYFASHKDPFESAVAGVYVHSKIGEILYKEKGLHITSNDVINKIPEVLKEFDRIGFNR